MLLSEKLRNFCELAIDNCDINDCWLWKGALIKEHPIKRYGGKNYYVHRLMWAHYNNDGILPENLQVHHTCERGRCINPDHLEGLTRKEHRKAHTSDLCVHGHDKRVVGITTHGMCRICFREADSRFRLRRKANK